MFWRALRWVGITFTYAFCILTFLSIAMENSGLLKTGGSQSEYEPSSQQVVKFSDVHGVDEAKEELKSYDQRTGPAYEGDSRCKSMSDFLHARLP